MELPQDARELFVGRVRALSSTQPPDTVGALTLANLSPISVAPAAQDGPAAGGWSLEVGPTGDLGHTWIEDVILHLLVATRSETVPVPGA